MKFLLKFAFFLVVAFCANSTKAKAQTGPVVCRIIYDYDVAGNRIKRKHECKATYLPGDTLPWTEGPTLTSIFPNPTTGSLTGTFSEPVSSAIVVVTTMGGITVFQQEYSQLMSSFTIDISSQLPGQYLVTVAAFSKIESYVITKL